MIGKGTFGGTPAATKLDSMIVSRQDSKLTAIVSRHVLRFQGVCVNLRDLRNKAFHRSMLEMCKEKTLSNIKSADLPNEIESHLCNYIMSMYRKEVKSRETPQ